MLNRIEIIQKLVDKINAEHYLEIGVNNGRCFLRIDCKNKIAVDPTIKIPKGRRLKHILKNPSNFNNKYFEQTSDDFFDSSSQMLRRTPPEVVFVDGLHTYQQAYVDVINSFEYLAEGGVVLMHDCNPATEVAGYPADSIEHAQYQKPDTEDAWNGDVWKAVVRLRSMHPDLAVFTLDCDYGIGVVVKGAPESTLTFSEEEIAGLTYKDFEKDRTSFLNLKSPDYFTRFLDDFSRAKATNKISH